MGVHMKIKRGSDIINVKKGFKEENAVVEAVGQGYQIILIRNKANVSNKQFLLYPYPRTHFKKIAYSIRDDIREPFVDFFRKYREPQKYDGAVEVKYFAQVDDVIKLTESMDLNVLARYSMWKKEHLEDYIDYEKAHVWILRVYELKRPIFLSNDDARDFFFLDKAYSKIFNEKETYKSSPVLTDKKFKSIKKSFYYDIGMGTKPKRRFNPDSVLNNLKEPYTSAIDLTQFNDFYNQMNINLSKSLSDKILKSNVRGFKRILIDLFTAMGYENSAKIIKKSSGFNIEGVFGEDILGLDKIYLRAKHHKRRKIYREDMEDYVKYLKGNKIQKGIFLTTTSFDYEALKYANRVKENIVLIDLEKLVDLMIRFKVGVSSKEILEINEIDDNYFDN